MIKSLWLKLRGGRVQVEKSRGNEPVAMVDRSLYVERLNAIHILFDWKTGRRIKRKLKEILNHKSLPEKVGSLKRGIRMIDRNVNKYNRVLKGHHRAFKDPEEVKLVENVRYKLKTTLALKKLTEELLEEIEGTLEYRNFAHYKYNNELLSSIEDLEKTLAQVRLDIGKLKVMLAEKQGIGEENIRALIKERDTELNDLESLREQLLEELAERQEKHQDERYQVCCVWWPRRGLKEDDEGSNKQMLQVGKEIESRLWSVDDSALLRAGNSALSNPGQHFAVLECAPLEQVHALCKRIESVGFHYRIRAVDPDLIERKLNRPHRIPMPNELELKVEEKIDRHHEVNKMDTYFGIGAIVLLIVFIAVFFIM